MPRLEPREDTTAFPWKRWWSQRDNHPQHQTNAALLERARSRKANGRANRGANRSFFTHHLIFHEQRSLPRLSQTHTQAAAKSATGAGSVSDRATIAEVSRRERCPVAPACVSRKAFVRSVEQDQSRRAGWLQSEKPTFFFFFFLSPSRKERRATRLDAAVN